MKKSFKKLIEAYTQISMVLSKEQNKKWVVLIIMTIIGSFLEMLGVSLIVPLIKVILDADAIISNTAISVVFQRLGIEDATDIILTVGIGTTLVYVVKNLYMTLLSWKRVKFAAGVQKELSVSMMRSYMNKGYIYFINTNTGEMQRRIQNDAEGVYHVLLQGMRMIAEIFSVICICIVIFIIDWKMACCITLFGIVGFILVSLTCRRYIRRIGKEFQRYNSLVNSSLIQTVQGIKEITVMQCKEFFVGKYEKALEKRQKIVAGQVVAAESPAYLIEAVCVAGMLMVVSISALNSNEMTGFVSSLGAFAIAAFRILPSVGKITNYLNNFMFYYPSLNSIYENMENLKQESIENKICIDKQKEQIIFENELELKGIQWKYPDSEKSVIKGLDLKIKKGMSVGFIGASGAGKTTVADIILGLFEPQAGKILMDGKERYSSSENWHKIIGYVPQNIYLMDDSVRSNVAFGVEEENISDDAVWNALEQAQLKEFVKKLPQGLDTQVGDRGVRFSGGQRQRMAIARALYHDPEILVLDEATSALDTETENAVMEAINLLHNKKTMIIVAHRLSTIENCDAVYEIVDGKASLYK